MGKIKTVSVKRLAENLIEKYPEKFSPDFSKNKEILDEFGIIKSKKIRNVIAGYVSKRLKGKIIKKETL